MLKLSCALVGLLFVLAGCGGDDDDGSTTRGDAQTGAPTKAEFIAQADEICAEANFQLDRIEEAVADLEPQDTQGLIEQVRRTVTITADLARDLRELPRPADDAEIRQYLAALVEQISLLRGMARAIDERDLEAASDLNKDAQTTNGDLYALGRGYGFKQCGVSD